MSAFEREGLDQGLRALRAAAERGLARTSSPQESFDPAALVKFSPALPAELTPTERHALAKRAHALEPWFQGPFLLGGDLVVGGAWRNDQRWVGLAQHVPSELTGLRVLDVGSNAGYDAFMFKLRGAEYLLACEPFAFHEQALFLESIYQSGADFRRLSWQELNPDEHGRFDLVHCNGVLYHEMHPVALLQRLRLLIKPSGTLLLGSMLLAEPELSEYMRFVPGSYCGDETWWWVPGRLAVRWMLEAVGFEIDCEFGTSAGPPGSFAVQSAYLKARPAPPVEHATYVSAQ